MEESAFRLRNMQRALNYSTFFGEWGVQDDHVLIHLFPRAGFEDEWVEGHYVPYCNSCGSGVPNATRDKLTKCPKCGHAGLKYIPGRGEVKSKMRFPSNMFDKVKSAVDRGWEGLVAIEPVDLLGSYVVQIQGAARLPEEDIETLVETVFDSLDERLEER